MRETFQTFNGNDMSSTGRETRPAPLIWGSHTREDLNQIINYAYDEIVFWRKNVFMLPSGAAGKAFVKEIDRLISAWNCNSENLQNNYIVRNHHTRRLFNPHSC